MLTLESPPAPSAPAPRPVRHLAALRLEVFDLTDPVIEGQETEYLVRVTNQGNTPAHEIRLHADCPAELKPVAISNSTQEVIKSQEVNLASFDLEPKASRTFRVTFLAVSSGDARVKVSLTGQELDSPVVEQESTTVYLPK
jgi:hypothetical protein